MTEPGPAPLWTRLVQAVSELGISVSLLSALLVYYGWVRAEAQARAMGLDVHLFGYTTQDYLLLSISSLYVQLFWIAVAVLAGVWADRRVRERVDARVRRSGSAPVARWARRGTWLLVGLAAAGLVLERMVRGHPEAWLVPFVTALCVLGAVWAAGLRRRATAPDGPAGTPRDTPRGAPRGQLLGAAALVSVVGLLVFSGTSAVAKETGRIMAGELQDQLGSMPHTVVYSEKPLHVGLPGVGTEQVGTADDPLYRYDGLRLLTLRGGRYFLLPEHWTVAGSTVLVLSDDDSIRLEYSR